MFLGLLALGLTLALTLGAGLAQEPQANSEPLHPISIEGEVASKFSYQGMLREDGAPVSGNRLMSFRLYSDDTCITAVGSPITKPSVPVANGLFDVELAFSRDSFKGQGLWLRVWVETTPVACEEILPVPYALSLAPGATIEGTTDELLVIDNTSTLAERDTLILRNVSSTGEALEVAAVNNAVAAFAVNGYGVWGDSDFHHGVYGKTGATAAAGVLARGYYQGADLLLGGNDGSGTGDDGRIHSDPQYVSSDIILVSNDVVSLYLDQDGDGEDADFLVYDKDDNLIFGVDESGDVTSGGPGVRAFPRPAYDSGWRAMDPGTSLDLPHSLGGSTDNYLVELTFRHSSHGTHAWGLGGDVGPAGFFGAYWRNLTDTHITVERAPNDTECPLVRVRIWVYP